MPENEIQHAAPVPPFVTFVASAVPMVFDNSMSYYEALCALWKWLQDDVIDVINNNASVTNEYINLTNQLHDYVENYFDNLNVQQEINNKLDKMAEDGSLTALIKAYVDPIYQAYETEINSALDSQDIDIANFKANITDQVSVINTKVNQATSGSPLVASSVAGMTNTNRIYVNTTDGNWYYYDGDSWEIGGVYQSAVDPYDVEDLYNIVLKQYTEYTPRTDAYYDNTIGNVLVGAASQNWQAAVYNVTPGEYYQVRTTTFYTSVHCAVFADADNRVISRHLVATSATNTPVVEVLQAPENAVYLYVNNHSPEDNDVGTVYRKAWLEDLAEVTDEVNDLAEDVRSLQISVEDADPYGLIAGKRPTIIGYNSTNKNLTFSFITDTHCNGYYSPNEKATANVKLFTKASNEKFIDFCAFGGDSYSAYNLTHNEGVNACSEMTTYISNLEPLMLPVKGNHEANGKYMSLADLSELDWDHNTYYIYSNANHAYVSITEAQWDGETPLHTGSFPDTSEEIQAPEYYAQMLLRAKGSVISDANNPYEAWYYKDFDEYQIRVIVLNAFDSNDGETNAIHGTQLKWFAEEALDLSDKDTPSNWEVLILSHYYQTANNEYTTKFKGVTDAFIGGSSVSGTLNSVSYSANYSSQGAGTIIALIHGHRHTDTYASTDGFNHIGVTRGYATVEEQGTASEYAFDIFTIDKANQTIYETRIGRGNSRSYVYGANPHQLS